MSFHCLCYTGHNRQLIRDGSKGKIKDRYTKRKRGMIADGADICLQEKLYKTTYLVCLREVLSSTDSDCPCIKEECLSPSFLCNRCGLNSKVSALERVALWLVQYLVPIKQGVCADLAEL